MSAEAWALLGAGALRHEILAAIETEPESRARVALDDSYLLALLGLLRLAAVAEAHAEHLAGAPTPQPEAATISGRFSR